MVGEWGGGGNMEGDINMKKFICNAHGGAVKKMKVPSKKWGFVPRLDRLHVHTLRLQNICAL